MSGANADEVQLPYLETFSKAAESSNFTLAARALGLTQAAVSQRVHALEETLGTPLFRRRGGRVLLTPAGPGLYDFAHRILALPAAARQEVTGRETLVASELLLAASSIPGEHFLPSLLSVFSKKHPNIRVRATIGDSMGVMVQVEKGEVSLGLVGRKTENPH